MLVVIVILLVIIKLAYDAVEDAELRDIARRNGYSSYASSRGVRNVSNNKPGLRKDKW